MTNLILACLTFLAIHLLVSATPARTILIDRFGIGPYRGLFSVASAGTLIWMAFAYAYAERIPYWGLSEGMRWLVALAMAPALLLLIAGSHSGKLDAAAPKGIYAITRHPVLCAVALWALLHLIANPSYAGFWFFGALLLLALAGPVSIDHKTKRDDPQKWAVLAENTSWLPFAAMMAGRSRLRVQDFGWRIPLAAAILYLLLLLWLHGWLFGKVPL